MLVYLMHARLYIAAALLLSLLGVSGLSADELPWQNSLRPEGEAAGQFTLTDQGRPAYTIAIPVADGGAPTSIQRHAARELQHWIEQISGAGLEIVVGAPAPPRSIRLETDTSLGDEGYRIAAAGETLILAGGKGRGLMNAVFAFLEEDLGCRFYTQESIRLPQSPTLAATPVARSYSPQLRLRDPFYKVAFDPVWSLRNRTNAPEAAVPEEQGGHVDYGGMFVHTAAQLVPAEKYFAEHPEYYYLAADGKRAPHQLCATDPQVLEIATATVLAVLAKNPQTEIISVSKNDNAGDQICHCERCSKLREAEGGTDMACQLALVNGIAEAVEQQYPHVTIDTLAYLETIGVPKTVRPRKNVAVRFCNDRVGAWVHPFTPASACPAAEVAAAWASAHDRLYVWDYNVNFSHYLAPMPNLDVMAANIRFWASKKAEGVMLQGGYQGPAERDELKAWVTSKLLWDPSRDEKALAADFIAGHYGPAASAIAEYEALLTGLRAEYPEAFAAPPGGIRYPMDAPFLTKAFLDKATELFDQARQLAEDDEALLRRVERAELPILYVKCARGPEFIGEFYPQVVADFERIARREELTYIMEWTNNFESTLAAWKEAAATAGSQ